MWTSGHAADTFLFVSHSTPTLLPSDRLPRIPMIDRQTIQRILDASDIVEVVKEFVTLRKAGVNYKGLCPFHNERTPSFVVSPSKQLC